MNKKILITGGTGMLGTRIQKLLQEKAYDTAVLSRNKKREDAFHWDYKKGYLDIKALEFADIIIHLAGENISHKRWTAKQKKEIYESRILSTKLLFDKIKETGLKPKKFISASAIGYYGTETSDKIFTEADQAGNDFLAHVVKDWEKEVEKMQELDIETLIYRIGVIFTPDKAALEEMMKPLRFKLAFPLGSGQQYLAWVSLKDAARAFVYGVESEDLKGKFNLVSPNPIKQKEIMKFLAQKAKALYFPVPFPAFLLYLFKGEMADIIVKGSRISSQKLISKAFVFRQAQLKDLFL